MIHRKHSMIYLLFLFSILFSGFLTGCSGKSTVSTGHDLTMMPLTQMSAEVQAAPVAVQQAYQFAAANPGVLKLIPCYCGCGKMGHTSNYSCYIQGVDNAGKISYDTHALGCSICVDITQDVMRLLKDKKPVREIRSYIDSTYLKYGPSNMSGSGTPAVAPASIETRPIEN